MTGARVISHLRRTNPSFVRDLLLVMGLGIFAALSWQVGLGKILSYLEPLGWRFVLVFLPYILVFVLDTMGWRYAFERTPPLPVIRLLVAQIVGKAANVITPLLPVGGEPIKACLLHADGVPLPEALASVVISRTVATIAHGLFILAVAGFTFLHLGLPLPLLKATGAVLLTGAVLVGAFLFAQTHGLFAGLLGMGRRLKPGLASWEEGARDLDRRISDYYRHRRARFGRSLTFHVLSWLGEGLEVYVLLMVLALPRSFAVAIAVAAFSSAVRAASFMIPGSLGVQEGGNVFIFLSFGLPADAAMAFSILRRLREAGWTAAGLLLLWWSGLEQTFPPPASPSAEVRRSQGVPCGRCR